MQGSGAKEMLASQEFNELDGLCDASFRQGIRRKDRRVLIEAIKEHTRQLYGNGFRTPEQISEMVLARLQSDPAAGIESDEIDVDGVGSIIASIAIAVLAQVVALIVKRLIEKWLNK